MKNKNKTAKPPCENLGNMSGYFAAIMAGQGRADSIYEYFFNLSNDMFCIAGMDGFFRLVNPAFERILGFTKQELCSRPYREFIHPADLAKKCSENIWTFHLKFEGQVN